MVAVKEKREKEEQGRSGRKRKRRRKKRKMMERGKKSGECRKKPRRTTGHTDTKAHSVRRLSLSHG